MGAQDRANVSHKKMLVGCISMFPAVMPDLGSCASAGPPSDPFRSAAARGVLAGVCVLWRYAALGPPRPTTTAPQTSAANATGGRAPLPPPGSKSLELDTSKALPALRASADNLRTPGASNVCRMGQAILGSFELDT
eukprot:scaffold19938_cov17-Tisochrysis_lutea.AAC.1